MPTAHSPLRYPGGKQILTKVLGHLIKMNGTESGTYVEPYAGGAGAALGLLYGEYVDRIIINDKDRCIYSFWQSCLHQTSRMIDMIQSTPLTIEEWRRQRDIYQHPKRHSVVRVGFATFYLNRCNRSGIITNAGPIGGIKQRGRWKIDARFNRDELERRIRKIALHKDRIEVTSLDALEFLGSRVASLGPDDKPFVYLDPPYYCKGQALYLNHYSSKDHAKVARHMKGTAQYKWVMSYDNVPEIVNLYKGLRQVPFNLDYSARDRRQGKEIMISRRSFKFPHQWERRVPQEFISSADGLKIPEDG